MKFNTILGELMASLLFDENGVSEEAFNNLDTLINRPETPLSQEERENYRRVLAFTDATDGRFYLDSEDWDYNPLDSSRF